MNKKNANKQNTFHHPHLHCHYKSLVYYVILNDVKLLSSIRKLIKFSRHEFILVIQTLPHMFNFIVSKNYCTLSC